MDSILTQHQKQFITKQDNLVKEAFTRKGVDVTDTDFIKENVSRIIIEGDKFEHYYLFHGTSRELRIISIQRVPEITHTETNTKYTITANCKYY